MRLPPSNVAKLAPQKIWQVPEAVVTVLCTPHDEYGWHPKHVEWTCRIINRLLCVASCWTIINIYYARYHQYLHSFTEITLFWRFSLRSSEFCCSLQFFQRRWRFFNDALIRYKKLWRIFNDSLNRFSPLIAMWCTVQRKVKVKVKCTPVQALRLCTGRTAHRGSRGIVLLFLGYDTRRGCGVIVTPRPLSTPGKTRYPLHRSLGGLQGRSGQVRKISPPPVFDPRTVQPVASRYTDYCVA